MADGLRSTAAPASTEELMRKMNDFVALRKKAEDKYQQQRADAIDELYQLEEKRATELYSTLAKLGKDQQKIKEDMAAASAVAEKERALQQAQFLAKTAKGEDKKKAAAKAKELASELKEKKKNLSKEQKETYKLIQAQNKKIGEDLQANLDSAISKAWENNPLTQTALGKMLFGGKAIKSETTKQVNDYFAERGETATADQLKRATGIKQLANVVTQASSMAKELMSLADQTAGYRSKVDTRLQGSTSNSRTGLQNSYWQKMTLDISSYVGMSPLVKQTEVLNKLASMIDSGISYNVEQRAFLDTISDKIATTFNATDATLLKLVRIQQQDTTAARLGMESALTAFLNNMYETTEYMSEAASSIRSSLYEASALMGAKSATEFEYQVQKWMGSLYSVGFSNTSGLASALGKLAAGDISGISDGGYGNLLVMAANQAGISITDALTEGLDASKTNELMSAMVSYLSGIYNDTHGSNILAQQYASVFGLTASDLKAAASLNRSNRAVSGNGLSYGGMLAQLNNMANSMYSRTGVGEMMSNMKDNLKFGIASTMANSPIMYATYLIADMLDDTVGGLPFSTPLVMGTGLTQTFKVSDIMKAGVLGGGILGSLGTLINGIAQGSGGGFIGSGMLKAFGIGSGNNVVTRGTGQNLLSTGITSGVSNSGYIGNANGNDIQNRVLTDQKDANNESIASAKDTSDETTLTMVDDKIANIIDLLEDVISGSRAFHVDVGDSTGWQNVLSAMRY